MCAVPLLQCTTGVPMQRDRGGGRVGRRCGEGGEPCEGSRESSPSSTPPPFPFSIPPNFPESRIAGIHAARFKEMSVLPGDGGK